VRNDRTQDAATTGFDLPRSLWPALHRLASGEAWPPSSEEVAERFVERAVREGLLPLLFTETALPDAVAVALERRRALERLEERRAVLFREAIARLAEILAGEPFAFLKGCDYAWRLYPRQELRPMQDIDILVPTDRIDTVTARLDAAGALQQFPAGVVGRTPRHYERVFALGPINVDVHQGFLPPLRLRVDYREVWSRRVPVTEPAAAFRLSDVDALLLHAVAMAKDEFTVPLIRYVDLWLILRREPELLMPAVERARAWRAERPLYGALAQAERLFPEVAEFVTEPYLARLLSGTTRRFLDRHVLPAPGTRRAEGRLSRARQLWRKFWLIGGFPRRFGFALYYAAEVVTGLGLELRARRRRRTSGSFLGG